MRQKRIALLLDIKSDYEHGIARGVIRYSKEVGAWKLFGRGFTLGEFLDIKQWEGDGVIAILHGLEEAESLREKGLPAVDVAGAVDYGFSMVTNGDYDSGQIAGKHLLACGCTNFAYCGVPEAHWALKRYEGFRDKLVESEIELDYFDLSLETWENPIENESLKRFITGLKKPVGIMAANDTIGVRITDLCKEEGIVVPHEVAVIGVDNEDVLCELSDPSLSSIPCDCERIGYEAAAVLGRMMSGEYTEPVALEIPPKTLVLRASSNTIITSDEIVRQSVQYIHENAFLGINVSDVVKNSSVGRRALEKRFREALSTTIHEEIKNTRLQKAMHMLLESTTPAAVIAEACGFSSPQRFHAVFMKEFNKTPMEFRGSK